MTDDEQLLDDLVLGRQGTLLSEVSAEEYVTELIKRTTRSESVNIFEGISDSGSNMLPSVHFGYRRRLMRSGSAYVPPKITESVLEQSQKFLKTDSALFLKERGILRHMIQAGDLEEARQHLK